MLGYAMKSTCLWFLLDLFFFYFFQIQEQTKVEGNVLDVV